jgi:hypothetical protein
LRANFKRHLCRLAEPLDEKVEPHRTHWWSKMSPDPLFVRSI